MITRQLATLFVLFVMVTVCPAAAPGEVKVMVDPERPRVSESFQLIFETEGDVDGSPDFSPLAADFKVLSTSQSSNFSIINGRSTGKKSWNLMVLAQRSGSLQIPEIDFGNVRSPARAVEVSPDSEPHDGKTGSDEIVFLEVESQLLNPYVQAQGVYTVRLYRTVPIANASLSEPKAEQGEAIIERYGEDREYQARVNKRAYQVIERRYVIYPQSSGTLRIGPLSFQGRIGDHAFSLFGPFGKKPRMVVRESAPVELAVKPIPKSYTGAHWLPARLVTLTESWSPEPPTFKTGTPVTRTITITAEGASASQLPELSAVWPAGLQTYPDKPELQDSLEPQGMVATRIERTALIPTAGGDVELPEIKVVWWNVATEQLEVAVLPARKLHVEGAASASASPPVVSGQANDTAKQNEPASATDQEPSSPQSNANAPRVRFWQWLSGILACGWFITVVAWWRLRPTRQAGANDAPEPRLSALKSALQSACARHDRAAAKNALLGWAARQWPDNPPRSLGALATRLEPPLAQEIKTLDACLYSKDNSAWNGSSLWREFALLSKRPPTRTATGGKLEPLFRI